MTTRVTRERTTPGRTGDTSRRALRHNQETDNPCYKVPGRLAIIAFLIVLLFASSTNEHLQSLRCLDSNQKDRNACEPYFLNYKNCKNFWASVQTERRSKGIKPYMPPLEERVKIKAEYLNSR